MKEDSSGEKQQHLQENKVSNTFLKKLIHYIGRQEIRNQIQTEVLDPLINHIMKRVFPYIILTCVLFVLLLIAVLLTLGIIIFQFRNHSIALMSPIRGNILAT
jgi:hypothetical protein